MAATSSSAGPHAEGIEFGIYLPQVAIGFDEMLARALECERLGYDSLWLYDHFYAPGLPLTSQASRGTITNCRVDNNGEAAS